MISTPSLMELSRWRQDVFPTKYRYMKESTLPMEDLDVKAKQQLTLKRFSPYYTQRFDWGFRGYFGSFI